MSEFVNLWGNADTWGYGDVYVRRSEILNLKCDELSRTIIVETSHGSYSKTYEPNRWGKKIWHDLVQAVRNDVPLVEPAKDDHGF